MVHSKFELSAHAATVISARQIELSWLGRALASPERTEPGKFDPQLTCALARIAERDNRVLRVVYNASVDPLRVVTAYFDRGMRGKL